VSLPSRRRPFAPISPWVETSFLKVSEMLTGAYPALVRTGLMKASMVAALPALLKPPDLKPTPQSP
jgi:hypothetical protein